MVSEDEVKKIAKLARLDIEQDFVPVVTGHLNSILEYVERLKEVDTSGIAAMSHVSESTNVLREDELRPVGSSATAQPLGDPTIPVQDMLPGEALLQNAPDSSGRFIKVPLIVE
jgi:aspartyl-tRNA(Asn)/glutamyl-tRNA(Gln) amidotransferase subunit C